MKFRDDMNRPGRQSAPPSWPKFSGKAWVGLALSFSSLFCCLWLFTAIPGIALGAIARREIQESENLKGDLVAMAAIVVGVIGCIVPLLVFLLGTLVYQGFHQARLQAEMDMKGIRIEQVAEENQAELEQVGHELLQIESALESYRIDFAAYPPAEDVDVDGGIVTADKGFVPSRLTTPIPYLSQMPTDPFRSLGAGGPSSGYRYATDGKTCWILISNGPDGDEDIPGGVMTTIQGACAAAGIVAHRDGHSLIYDPTNGADSNGDIIHTLGTEPPGVPSEYD